MKILLIVHQFFPKHRTGTEVLTLELARGLLRKGHHVEVLTGAFCAGEAFCDRPRRCSGSARARGSAECEPDFHAGKRVALSVAVRRS